MDGLPRLLHAGRAQVQRNEAMMNKLVALQRTSTTEENGEKATGE